VDVEGRPKSTESTESTRSGRRSHRAAALAAGPLDALLADAALAWLPMIHADSRVGFCNTWHGNVLGGGARLGQRSKRSGRLLLGLLVCILH